MINLIKRKWKICLFILVLTISLVILYFFLISNNIKKNEYKNDYFYVSYDSTWKVDSKDKDLILEHKKSKSSLIISYKGLDDNLIDVSLDDIINNVVYSIDKQNEDYKKLNKNKIDGKFEGYQLLYEKDNKQSLVTIFKKDNVLVFVTYNAKSEYFDIVLDSVESIINSLDIYSGEK